MRKTHRKGSLSSLLRKHTFSLSAMAPFAEREIPSIRKMIKEEREAPKSYKNLGDLLRLATWCV